MLQYKQKFKSSIECRLLYQTPWQRTAKGYFVLLLYLIYFRVLSTEVNTTVILFVWWRCCPLTILSLWLLLLSVDYYLSDKTRYKPLLSTLLLLPFQICKCAEVVAVPVFIIYLKSACLLWFWYTISQL